jgi:hypothetical protein
MVTGRLLGLHDDSVGQCEGNYLRALWAYPKETAFTSSAPGRYLSAELDILEAMERARVLHLHPLIHRTAGCTEAGRHLAEYYFEKDCVRMYPRWSISN